MSGSRDPEHVLRRARRLVLLSILLCAVATVFFFMRVWWVPERSEPVRFADPIENTGMQAPNPAAQTEKRQMMNGPEPSTFRVFVYDPAQPKLSVSGVCADVYATVIIFPAEADYRWSPHYAVYNAAEPCTGKTFSREIDLSSLNLKPGHSYYVIRAQQGAEGMWHDPQ